MSDNVVNRNDSSRLVTTLDILARSRYRAELSGFAKAGGRSVSRLELTHREFLDFEILNAPGSYIYHHVETGDRIDNLAFDFLNDTRLWWVIADMNPLLIKDTNILPVGEYIKIPTLDILEELGV